MKLIKFKINGKEIETQEGTTILNAALDNGIHIPHFCFHKGIGIEGSCRMCLVELKNAPKLVISCATPVKEGVEVFTDSEKVRKSRKSVLEFLLANHPLDCPICDKGGECPLQDYAYAYGKEKSRFSEEKNTGIKHKIFGEHIIFDSERCILCTRCVRFAENIMGYPELGRLYRGAHTYIGLFADKKLRSDFSGNYADFCPVGALTLRDYRFKARPWELEKTESSCMACSIGCSSYIWTKKGKILRKTPKENKDLNSFWLCDRGRFHERENLKKTNRNQCPKIKEKDFYTEITWSKAKKIVRDSLYDIFTKYKDGSIGVVIGKDILNEEYKEITEIFTKGFKAEIMIEGLDETTITLFKKLNAKNALVTNLEELNTASKVFVLGEDPFINHPVLGLRLRELAGEKLFIIHEENPLYPVNKYIKQERTKFFEDLALGKDKHNLLDSKNIIIISDSWLKKDSEILLKEKELPKFIILTSRLNHYPLFSSLNPVHSFSRNIKSVIIYGDLFFPTVFFQEFENTLSNLSLFTVFSTNGNGFQNKAHLIIPGEYFFEKNGTFTNFLGKECKINRPVKYEGLEISNLEFIREIVQYEDTCHH